MIKILKTYIVNIFLVLIVCGNRLDFNSTECKIYLGKFGFNVDATFVGGTSDVQINLRYNDTEYFNDPNYWGLVQEDGKSPETTCLDLKVFKFPSDDFKKGTQVIDLLITPSNNSKTFDRCYSFTIKKSDFSTRLIQTSNPSFYIYRGFYGIELHTSETNDKINWCSDFTCTTIGNPPDLHFNDSFVLQQVITKYRLKRYYLTETEVWYTGNGLNKQATIIQFDNTVAGQVKILLNTEIVWGNYVTIKVNSVLSDSTTFGKITGQNDQIPCIKAQNSDNCPACQQECDTNGYARDGCEACKVSGSTILYGPLLVMSAFLILN